MGQGGDPLLPTAHRAGCHGAAPHISQKAVARATGGRWMEPGHLGTSTGHTGFSVCLSAARAWCFACVCSETCGINTSGEPINKISLRGGRPGAKTPARLQIPIKPTRAFHSLQ